MIKKILWYVEKIGENLDHPYKQVTDEELNKMPVANIEMIDEQVENIFNMIKNKNDGVG